MSSSLSPLLKALARAPEVAVDPPRLPGGARVDRYEIVAHLGTGGMGEVYHAHDPRLGRGVALKLLRAVESADHLQRFTREARALAALSHPNIVAIHDIGAHDGRPFLALELLTGETLRASIARGGLDGTRALVIARQILSGLEAAHALGIVHRDLKPENLFLTRDGQVKLLDFGLAKRLSIDDPAHSQAGTVLGTASYMAPEQVRGGEVDARADLFAFGAVLWEMLCGRRAFAAASAVETMHRILADEPAPLDELVPGLEPGIASLVERCLSKEPAARFASAGEVLRALDEPTAQRTSARRARPVLAYANAGGLHLAFQTIESGAGDGGDLVVAPGFVSNIEQLWEDPESARFITELARRARVTMFDKRGTGLSDRGAMAPAGCDELAADLRAVAEAANARRPMLLGVSEGALMSVAFAAAYPERVRGLVLFGGFAVAAAQGIANLMPLVATWGSGGSLEVFAPSAAGDADRRRWWARWERAAASPGAVRAHLDALVHVDVRPLLPLVRVPTLVLHRAGDRAVDVRAGRDLARRLPDARYVELPGDDHLPMFGDAQRVLDEITTFTRECATRPLLARDLPAVLAFTPGTPAPTELAGGSTVGAELVRFARIGEAAAAAVALTRARPTTRVALHLELPDVSAADGARRLLAHARPGEVLTLGAARGLLCDAGFSFAERGLHRLGDGIIASALYALTRADPSGERDLVTPS